MKLESVLDPISGPSLFENRIACEWLDTKHAAIFLKCSVGAIRNMVYRNEIRFYKNGRKLMFRLSDLRFFLGLVPTLVEI